MQIILYSAPGSNCSQRVEWLLNYKQVSYIKQDVSKLDGDDPYWQINPFGYVPLVTVQGRVLAESIAIAEYFEELRQEQSLLPGTAYNRARIREICEYINSSVHTPQNRSVLTFVNADLDGAALVNVRSEWVRRCLSKRYSRLCNDRSFTVGESFSLANIRLYVICRKFESMGGKLLRSCEKPAADSGSLYAGAGILRSRCQ